MDILEVIRRLSVKRIQSLAWIPTQVTVEFEDGVRVSVKDTVGLRMWAAHVQHLTSEWIEGDRGHCTPAPLDHYVLLGFRPGDAVLFRDEHGIELPILFS